MKKILGIGVMAAILLASTPISYADSITVKDPTHSSFIKVTSQVSQVETNEDDPIITPMDVQLIYPYHYSNIGAYTNKFYLDPNNGLSANVWVQNTGIGTIYMQIKVDNILQLEVPFAPGVQKTIELYGTVPHQYELYIYNSTGIVNDFNISARQF